MLGMGKGVPKDSGFWSSLTSAAAWRSLHTPENRGRNKALMEQDKVFSNAMKKILDDLEKSTAAKAGKAAAQGASRSAGRGVAITQTNQSRSQNVNTKERQDAEDEQWYIDNYSRFWDAGFAPHGPDSDPSVKAYKKYIKTKDVFGK